MDSRQRLESTPGAPRSSGSRPPGRTCGSIHPPDPRLLTQPDRALLLGRPAQGAQPQQLRLAPRARRSVAALRRAVPPDRPTVRLDLRPRRLGARDRQISECEPRIRVCSGGGLVDSVARMRQLELMRCPVRGPARPEFGEVSRGQSSRSRPGHCDGTADPDLARARRPR